MVTGPATGRVLDALRSHQCKVTGRDPQWSAQCPAHPDHSPSLSIAGIEGQVLLYCHAGCETENVVAALGLGKSDLFDHPRGAEYRYDNGRTVHRTPDKRFSQGHTENPPELYHLSLVRKAVATGRTVYVVEGEKDVLSLEAFGEVATTSPQGAANADKVDWSPLARATVVLVPDNDDAGCRYEAAVRPRLLAVGCAVRVLYAVEGKDISDHLLTGHGLDELVPGTAEERSLAPVVLTMSDRALSRSELAKLPRPDPLIAGTLERRTVAVLAGPYGTGKSFLALGWGLSIGTGTEWLTRRIEHSGRVLYVASEGAFGLDARIGAWESRAGLTVPDEALTTVPFPVNLRDAGQVRELCAMAADHSFVVVDTLARCLVGADENSNRDVGEAVESAHRIRDAMDGGTVLVVHHVTKDGTTTRGASALEDGVDTVYKTSGDAKRIELQRTKRKDGPTADLLRLRLDTEAESCVLVSLGEAQATRLEEWRPTQLMTAVSDLLMKRQEGLSKAQIRSLVKGRDQHIIRAVELLVHEGYVIEDRPHHRYTIHRPYRGQGVPGVPGLFPEQAPLGCSAVPPFRGNRNMEQEMGTPTQLDLGNSREKEN